MSRALPEWWLLGLIAIPVIAYGASTFFLHRPADGYNTIWDGWVYNIAQFLPAIPVLWRVKRSPVCRSAWVALATGIILITVGNLVWTFHDQNLRPIPDPAPSDAIYLVAYAAFIVGVAILTQSPFGRIHASVRLDGAIAGLAIGAVAGMAWFEPLLHMTGRPLEVVVNMAYPLCDLVLIVLLVAGLAPHRYQPSWSTLLLMTGVAWFVIGDLATLNRIAANTYVPGTPLDETWPIGMFFIAVAASVRERRRANGRSGLVGSPEGITGVPVACGILSLGVLAVSIVRHDAAVVPAMAIAALGLVIGRMWMTLREVRHSVENYQDARTDDLTGLPNRRAFLERLQKSLSSATGSGAQAGVLLVDLDGFKEVNDALGHAAGDELLRVLGNRFDRRLASRGILARLGGDEYAFGCAVENEEDLVKIANEFSQALVDPCVLEGTSVRVGASIGAALSQLEGSTSGELLRCADVAMYEAKRMKSGLCLYRAEADPSSRDRLALLHALRDAIDARVLLVYYQPTLDMRTGATYGVEALVRWQHPELGLLEPDAFIPLAERNGLIPQLTRAVLDLAVAEAARLDREGHHLQMNVNISRHDLVDEDLGAYIDRVLALNGLSHERLTLEITESALGGDPDRAERCVRELRARGLRIAIDDFGVGYSSMSQLLELAIDELKIDKSFVVGLTTDARAQAIVRSAVELARALSLTVVAEGIESEETLEALRAMGADLGQGTVIGAPFTADQLEDYLALPDRFERFGHVPARLLVTGGF
jgi:diguanylate cyclase (GGDEF)-like protein